MQNIIKDETKMKNILKKVNARVISAMIIAGCFISMIPNWILAFFARPSGDDFGYSAATHQEWIQTHSLVEVIRAGVETTQEMCQAWNGDWFSVFFFTLMPEVFIPYSFWVVPLFWSLAMIAAVWYLSYQVMTKWLGVDKLVTGATSALILLMSYQWAPSSAIMLYWYVGVIHYIMPHVIALFIIGGLVKFLRTEKYGYIVWASIGMIAVGGSSYYAFFLVIFSYFFIFLYGGWKKKKFKWLIIPVVVGGSALLFQVTAPGNAARVGAGIGFTFEKAINTIIGSLFQGIRVIAENFREMPLIIFFIILTAAILWVGLSKSKTTFEFKFPLLFAVYVYGIYASMFTPEIYAETEISGGPPTMEYLTFILCSVLLIGYTEGWMIRKMREAGKVKGTESFGQQILQLCLVLISAAIIVCRNDIKETLFYESVEYITSGQAADFKKQIDSQMKILLDDSIKEAYLCPINPEQGPLMHMPVTEDPNAFTNWAVKNFYGKEKVVMKQ